MTNLGDAAAQQPEATYLLDLTLAVSLSATINRSGPETADMQRAVAEHLADSIEVRLWPEDDEPIYLGGALVTFHLDDYSIADSTGLVEPVSDDPES